MTVAVPTPVEQQISLFRDLREVLDRHPLGGAVRLIYAPQELPLADGEILVQEVDVERRVMHLRPVHLPDVGSGDVLHETQVLDPADRALSDYAQTASAKGCYMGENLNGTPFHTYI
ncbi:hypothetical protein [Streptomyces sp. NPDC046976]|uniref:hypothetical protein n=1 Tax=Streptomyces sp. NPDC046976 TaxID=3155258 RepID=UPI0033CBB2C0